MRFNAKLLKVGGDPIREEAQDFLQYLLDCGEDAYSAPIGANTVRVSLRDPENDPDTQGYDDSEVLQFFKPNNFDFALIRTGPQRVIGVEVLPFTYSEPELMEMVMDWLTTKSALNTWFDPLIDLDPEDRYVYIVVKDQSKTAAPNTGEDSLRGDYMAAKDLAHYLRESGIQDISLKTWIGYMGDGILVQIGKSRCMSFYPDLQPPGSPETSLIRFDIYEIISEEVSDLLLDWLTTHHAVDGGSPVTALKDFSRGHLLSEEFL
jgi:hypothetical protein